MTTEATLTTPEIDGLYPTTPEPLSFAPSVETRAFLLEREQGNILVYNAAALEGDVEALRGRGGAARQYLNHSHEAMFGPDAAARALGAKVLVNRADEPSVTKRGWHVDYAFSRRHRLDDDFEAIPIPGHTPGATAYLWDTGDHRLLFTGDSLYLRDGEWVAAVLESSDREAYIASLELLREVEFDVLVPWAAEIGRPFVAPVGPGEARERIDAVLERVRSRADG